jgi:hypothetical protein
MNQPLPHTQKRRGFNLIELVGLGVVVGLIYGLDQLGAIPPFSMKEILLFVACFVILLIVVLHDDKKNKRKIEETIRDAELGLPEALYEIGYKYDKGDRYLQRDLAKALAYYQSAAEKGYVRAQLELGLRYLFGTGVQKDVIKAYFWLFIAAQDGHSAGQAAMKAKAKKLALTVSQTLTSVQIEEAQNLAQQWNSAHSQLAKAP